MNPLPSFLLSLFSHELWNRSLLCRDHLSQPVWKVKLLADPSSSLTFSLSLSVFVFISSHHFSYNICWPIYSKCISGRATCGKRKQKEKKERERESRQRRPSGTPHPQEVDRAPQGLILVQAGSGRRGPQQWKRHCKFELNRVFYSTFLYCEWARFAGSNLFFFFSSRSFYLLYTTRWMRSERSAQDGWFCSVVQLGHPRKRKKDPGVSITPLSQIMLVTVPVGVLRLEIWLFFSYGELL